jgi:hypothetical protein
MNGADTVFVLDGVNGTVTRLALPASIRAFQALEPAPELGLLIGAARNTVAGDAGLIVFDLENLEARVMPVPAEFMSVTPIDVFPLTRKALARGLRPRNQGSALVIYDLNNGEPTVIPNPDGVVSFGPLQPPQITPGPVQPPAPGQPPLQQGLPTRLLLANPKANTVTAIVFNGDSRQAGLMMVRVP